MVVSPVCRISFRGAPLFDRIPEDQNPTIDERSCFIAGPENVLVPTVVDQIVKPFSIKYSVIPVVFWGGRGTGKSLLARGLVKRCRSAGQEVCFFDGERVGYPALRKKYFECNRATLWVIDNFDQISVNESLVNLFCDLLDLAAVKNYRVVTTMHVPPNAIFDFPDRLRSRFNAGLIVKLNPLAGKNRLAGEFNEEVNPALIDICRVISKYFGVSVRDLKGRSRQRGIVFPRQLLMYLAHESYKHSLKKIGIFLGRDHSTVLHGCQMIEEKLATDTDMEIQNHILLLQNSFN